MPAVVGLTGYAGSGKDLVGALLAMRGYKRIAFADAVRMEVSRLLLHGGNIPAQLSADSRTALSGGMDFEDVWIKPTNPMMRKILQEWGTEFRRTENPDYWICIVDDQVKALGDRPVVITDVRFGNECDWIRHRGGVVLRVRRGDPANSHFSERSVDTLNVDAEIDNTGMLQELPGRVLAALGIA